MTDQAFDEAEQASSLLRMARQLHEQHVSSAREEAKEIVESAQAEANELLTAAREERDRLVADSKEELERLQVTIQEHRAFEEAYRNSIRTYLTGLLDEVNEDQEEKLEIPESVELYSPVAAPAFELTEDENEVIDPDDTFEDDAIDPEVFDKLAEPDASAEDIDFVTDFPATESIDTVEDSGYISPDFSEEQEETPAFLAEGNDETVSVESEPVTEVFDVQSNDSFLESVADNPAVEIDNDGGSTVDAIEDDEEVTVPSQEHEINEESFSEIAEEAIEPEGPKFASFNDILSGNASNEKEEEETEEKPKFRFFGK